MKLSRRAVVLVFVGLAISAASVLATARPASAVLGLGCDDIPIVRCNVADLGSDVARTGLEFISDGIGDAASWMVASAGSQILEVSDVRNQIRNDGFIALYERDFGIALLMLVPLMFAATMRALIKGSPGDIVKIFVVYLPLAILLGFVAIFIVDSVLLGIDSLTQVVLDPIRGDIGDMVARVSYAGTSSVIGTLLLPIIALVLMFAALAVTIELIARDVILLATLAFIPLAFAGIVWNVTSTWLERTVRTIASFALMKLIMAMLLAAGTLVFTGELASADPFTDSSPVQLNSVTAGYLLPICGGRVSDANSFDSAKATIKTCVDGELAGPKFAYAALPSTVDGVPPGTTFIDDLDSVCLKAFDEAQSAQGAPMAMADVVSRSLGCYEVESGPATTIKTLLDRIDESGIDGQARLSGLLKNGIIGIVLFLTVALSPAIAFRLFDIFEGNIEQIRYARKGVGINPVSTVAGAQTQIQVADLLTRGKGSQRFT